MSNPNQFFQELSLIQSSHAVTGGTIWPSNASEYRSPEVDREIIAARIFSGAESGVRDARKLCERAIHGLTARELSAASRLMQGWASNLLSIGDLSRFVKPDHNAFRSLALLKFQPPAQF